MNPQIIRFRIIISKILFQYIQMNFIYYYILVVAFIFSHVMRQKNLQLLTLELNLT